MKIRVEFIHQQHNRSTSLPNCYCHVEFADFGANFLSSFCHQDEANEQSSEIKIYIYIFGAFNQV